MGLPDGVVRRKIFRYLVHYAQNFKSYLIFIKVNLFDIFISYGNFNRPSSGMLK